MLHIRQLLGMRTIKCKTTRSMGDPRIIREMETEKSVATGQVAPSLPEIVQYYAESESGGGV